MKRRFGFFIVAVFLVSMVMYSVHSWTPTPVSDDQNVFMPGSQPGQVGTFESPGRCDNCHGGYNTTVEPAYNWRGSMMAQAARDPLWLACLATADQDSIWAVGNPNAGDICIRCHSPTGWLEGRSDPTNTALLVKEDFDGVQCDFCHRMVDPFAELGQPDVPPETTSSSVASLQSTAGTLGLLLSEYPWLFLVPFFVAAFAASKSKSYVEKSWTVIVLALLSASIVTPAIVASQSMADETYQRDIEVLSALTLFDGTPFLDAITGLPTYYGDGSLPNYVESASGQYFVDPTGPKRGPFDDAPAKHQIYYSRFHKSNTFCSACHDVSNPILASVFLGASVPETQAAASYFHVERTTSEFMLSLYGREGAATNIPGISWADKCQDCHMQDVTGVGANKAGTPIRVDLPLHDLTGGNQWVSGILASVDPTGPAYDAYNYAILSGQKYTGAQIEVAGLSGYGQALLDGAQRATQQLQNAATLTVVSQDTESITLRVQNNGGHKLISGFPEGRRMFLSVQFFDAAGNLAGEINPYSPLVTTIDANGNEVYVSGGELVKTHEELVWEVLMSSIDLTGEQKTFHFALATDRYKDNRIPPKGFDTSAMYERLAQPRWNGADAPDYFTAEEYAGGYDDVTIAKPLGAAYWNATLYYQTTSREYVEFLRDEINGNADTLSSPTPSGELNAYIVQTDPFFSNLKGWGNAIWDLWLHNEGASPVTMESVQSHANIPPVASFTESAETVYVGEAINFDATGSYDPDGSIVSYSWDFGDGATATGAIVSHAYSASGTYTVTLTVADNDAATDTQTATKSVLPTIVQCQLTIGVTGMGTTTPAPGAYLYDAGTVVQVTAVPDSGYMLDHWVLDAVNVGSVSPYSVTMNTDHTLTGVFVEIPPVQYLLTISVTGSGTTDPAVGSHTYDSGTVVPVTATPTDGWMLDHWVLDSANVGATSPYNVTMNANHALEAVFIEVPPMQYQLTISVTGSGTTSPAAGTNMYDEGTVVPVTAYPADGWSLDYWLLDSVNVGNTNPYSVTMSAEHTIEAVFVETPPVQYELTIGITGSGTTNPVVGSYLYDEGTNVPVTAIPASGWIFDHWLLDSVDVGAANPYSVIMDADHALTAVFVEAPPGQHDIAVVLVSLSRNVIGQGYTAFINVTVENQGDFPETFNVTLYANATSIHEQTIYLTEANSTTLAVIWNTAAFAKGKYTIAAVAVPVSGETDIEDNTLTSGWTIVTLPGDVDGDRDVDIFDVIRIGGAYNVAKPDPRYDPNCDINGDGTINIFDVVIASGNYGSSW